MNWNELCEQIKIGAEKTVDKLGQTADIASLQVKLSVYEHKLDAAYMNLGRLTYRYHQKNSTVREEDVIAAVAKVRLAKRTAYAYRKRIDQLKAEQKKPRTENN